MPLTGAKTEPVVGLPQGTLIGRQGEGVQAFCGVPYALPPVQGRRWQPPAPVAVSNETLDAIYQFRLRLQDIWTQTSRNSSEMVEALEQWYHDARESGIAALQEFADQLTRYRPATVSH